MEIEIGEEMATLTHRIAVVIEVTETAVTFQHRDGKIETNDLDALAEYHM